MKRITIRSNKGGLRGLGRGPTLFVRLKQSQRTITSQQSKDGTRAGHCSPRKNKTQMIRKKKKKNSWFSHSRLYRKVSYSGSCALVAHSLVPPGTFSHAKAQLHFLPNFQICPSKMPLFLDFPHQTPFPGTQLTLHAIHGLNRTFVNPALSMSCCYDVRVHRAARAQRVPGKLPGSKQPLSKGSFRTNHVTKA